MKKIFLFVLTTILLSAFCACSNPSVQNDEQKGSTIKKEGVSEKSNINGKESIPEKGTADVNNVAELTPEDTALKYYEAMAALDYDTIFDLCVDPYTIENAISRGEFEDREAFKEDFAEEFEHYYAEEIMALGDNRKVSVFEVIETIEIPKEDANDSFRYSFPDEYYPEGSFSKAMVVTASITMSGDEEEVSFGTGNTPLIQIDGKWYIGTYLMSASSEKVEQNETVAE